MKTNEIKKGMRVLLANGWEATMLDNAKGNIRYAEVEGYVTESGSIYAHDIVRVLNKEGEWELVELTDKQKIFQLMVRSSGF